MGRSVQKRKTLCLIKNFNFSKNRSMTKLHKLFLLLPGAISECLNSLTIEFKFTNSSFSGLHAEHNGAYIACHATLAGIILMARIFLFGHLNGGRHGCSTGGSPPPKSATLVSLLYDRQWRGYHSWCMLHGLLLNWEPNANSSDHYVSERINARLDLVSSCRMCYWHVQKRTHSDEVSHSDWAQANVTRRYCKQQWARSCMPQISHNLKNRLIFSASFTRHRRWRHQAS